MIDEPPIPPDDPAPVEEPIEPAHSSPAIVTPASEPPSDQAPPSGEPGRSKSASRFAVPIIAVLILIAGLTSVWWLPLVRPTPHGPTTPSVAETVPAKPAVVLPAPTTTATNAELAARIDRLDEALSALQDSTGSSNAKADIDELDRRVTELGRKLDNLVEKSAVGPEQLAAVTDTVKQLGDRLSAVNGQLQRQDDARQHQAALLLATAGIATAISTSTSYAPALDALKAVGDAPDMAEALAVLTRYDNSEIPGRARLEWDLHALPARFDEPVEAAGGPGFWQRVLNRIEHLVRIRKTAEAGDESGKATPASVVAAAETELAAGDLGAAIQSMESLNGRPAELATPWLQQAKSRLQIEQASQALQAYAIRKLGPEGGVQP